MQATRDRIVEAAIGLYTEQGISRTTLRQVGERADVAPGTLRNHLASRVDLEPGAHREPRISDRQR
jgi:AcrR family transcriptional regulator